MRLFGLALAAISPILAAGVFDVRQFGARGDGKTLDSAAINKAVDAAAAGGGGTVLLPPGRYLSGTVTLKTNVTLHVAAGAVLFGSAAAEDYKPNGLIYALDAENVAIEGHGTIDGNGSSWWKEAGGPRPEPLRNRPSPMIQFVGCRRVRVHDVTLRNPAGWTVHPLECDDVDIRGISIIADLRGPNTDGIDIDSSRNVRISDCYLETGDDAIVVKTTGQRGGPVKPVENLTVTNCVITTTCNNFKIGTESRGDFRNIAVSNCAMFRKAGSFKPPISGIAVEMVDGAVLENVVVSNITMRDVDTPIFVRLGNRGRGQETPVPGKLRNISISNVIATGGLIASSISGLPDHPARHVSLSNLNITMKGGHKEMRGLDIPERADKYPEARMWGQLTAYGLYVRHAEGVTLRDIEFRWEDDDVRPAMVFDDAASVEVNGLRTGKLPGKEPLVWFNDVRDAWLSSPLFRDPVSSLLRVSGPRSGNVHVNSAPARKEAK